MVKTVVSTYKDSFKGLSAEVWWLALITFINRAGTMVLPFMSLYLTESLNFSLSQVGLIMSSFGFGSLLGSWLGGRLVDKIGYYVVMFWSLLLTGFLFIIIQFLTSFYGFVIGIFLTMTIADAFRPAMFVSLKAYSKLENQTRSLTLIRLAINLGFSFGPFLGGVIIAALSYSGLFWVDGVTCIVAVVLMRIVLKRKDFVVEKLNVESNVQASVYNDKPFWIFLVIVFLMGFVFLQLFTTLPLYYKAVYRLTEVQIGLIMSLNGLLIFILEMPLIHYFEIKLVDKLKIITWSLLLFALSFLVLNSTLWIGILILSMLLITVGEMLAFPFTNNFAMNRASAGKEGKYLALYAMAFSVSHIFSAKTGMEIIDRFGFNVNWYVMGGLSLMAFGLMYLLMYELSREKELLK